VPWEEISPQAALAVVAAEDQRFFDHQGFDLSAIRDVLRGSRSGERMRGASTITQQVAKNLFLWSDRSFLRKGLEAGLTVFIELLWPKRRILEVYLNVAQLGPGTFGFEAASQRYFRKSAAALTPSEAALLAAVLPNPERLRAERPSAYVRQRQAWVLRQMRLLGGTALLRSIDG
jgi:monofunctional biosynthetic peptidoglycan transglycosylase